MEPEKMKEKRKEKLDKMPNIENHIRLSKDGKWVIVTTEITKIYSKKYFDKVLHGGNEGTDEAF